MQPTILFILGTGRSGSVTSRIFPLVVDHARTRTDIQVAILDVADFSQSVTEGLDAKHTQQLAHMFASADGVVIVSPEYNHGYPGELKMLIDNLDDELDGKPVAIVGVSSGALGGGRMAEQLKLVLSAFQAIIINRAVYMTFAESQLNESGTFNDADNWYKKIDGMIDDVVRFIKK